MTRWIVAALLACSGCGFSLSGPDPNRPRNKLPACDTGKGAVVIDGLMATAMGVTTIGLMANDEASAALLPLAIGALYLGGALSGNRAVDACTRELAIYEQGYGGDQIAKQQVHVDDSDDEVEARSRYRRSPQPALDGPAQPPPQRPAAPPPPVAVPPVAVPPVPAQPVAAPAQSKPRSAGPAKPAPASDDAEWSEFWREVQ